MSGGSGMRILEQLCKQNVPSSESDIKKHLLDTRNLRFIEKFDSPLRIKSDPSGIKPDKLAIDRDSLRKHRRFEAIMGFYETPMYVLLPYSETAMIFHGEIYNDLASTEVSRLHGIKQLGTVSLNVEMVGCTQTRFYHSLLVAGLADILLTRLGFDQHEIDLAIAAGMLHDAAIPPYSDQGKLASREDLSEEKNIEMLIKGSEAIQKALKKYDISQKDVLACIRGEYPILGPLLNSKGIDLDRISYLAIDINSILVAGEFRETELKSILDSDPHVFEIYNEIRFMDSKPVFENALRAKRFLLLRALMYENCYYNTFNRSKEAFLEKELKILWNKGILNKQKMTTLADNHFLDIMKNNMNSEIYHDIFWTMTRSRFIETCRYYGKSKKQVEAVLKSMGRNLDEIAVKEQRGFDPGTDVSVIDSLDPKKRIYTFRDLYPDAAKRIEDISRKMAYTGVYERAPTRDGS